MFIPQDLNTPLIVGGILAHYIQKNKDEKLGEARYQRGTLISSGFIAGAALFGVIGALFLFFGMDLSIGDKFWAKDSIMPQLLAFLAFAALIIYFVWESKRASRDDI